MSASREHRLELVATGAFLAREARSWGSWATTCSSGGEAGARLPETHRRKPGLAAPANHPHLSNALEGGHGVAKKKNGKKARKASAKSDRALLELGEDLLTAVHLHREVQEDEVRAALAAAHPDLVQACGDLVARIAGRFLEESGAEADGRDRYARWAEAEDEVEAGSPAVEVAGGMVPGERGTSSH